MRKDPDPRAANSGPLGGVARFFRRATVSPEEWNKFSVGSREWEQSYRGRWAHDKVVRTTHGVNCTGSCSWRVYVRDGIITSEVQAVDYPSIGPDTPEYEPRGCPRGASTSWYTYAPQRVKYPYARASLVEMYRAAKARLGDPVEAWAAVTGDEASARRYKSERGRGGFIRVSPEEAVEMIAAAHVHTIRKWGPDRIAGFTPIPAMSMVSYSAGTRYLSLIGGVVLSFYDWYADLPPASPQTWGEQTDVPESGDWWNSTYLIIWGTNLPTTRTPDAHFFVEARYRGQKLVVISPDFAEHAKFADDWLPIHPGTDGALAMAMGHVILKEFYHERQVPWFTDYVRRFTDLPFLVTLRRRGDAWVADRFLNAADLGQASDNNQWKGVVINGATGEPAVPNGSIGFRYGEQGIGQWNLDLHGIQPVLSLIDSADDRVPLDMPRFDVGDGEGGGVMRRGVPVRTIGGQTVTTVFDLLMANYGVRRDGLPGDWPTDYADPQPHTPAWQESITGIDAAVAIRIAREFARNAEQSKGRSMIAMGAGTNHWYHSDQTYRTFLTLLLLCGCEGVNGGGWAHYVGQERVSPVTGWSQIAFAQDWVRPPRHMAGTAFWYLASDQWRYEQFKPSDMASPLGKGLLNGLHVADCITLATRLGWMPSYPTFNRSPLDVADEAAAAGIAPADHVLASLKDGRLRFAAEDPDAPENFPRVLMTWRGNILTSSAKGQDYFFKHLLGTETDIEAHELPSENRPTEVRWREPAPIGKLDLVSTIDFRMSGTCLASDIVLPAATWYEKHDLSTTDLHPFIHSFSPAIPPPWESRTDWDWFKAIAGEFSRMAAKHLGVRRDLIAVPLKHDSPGEITQPLGQVRDWRKGSIEPKPGVTMPSFVVVERNYPDVAARLTSLGPVLKEKGVEHHGIKWDPKEEVDSLARRNGTVASGPAAGQPRLATDIQVAEAILTLSGTTNGQAAIKGFKDAERRSGVRLADLAEPKGALKISFADTQAQPRTMATSYEWSGMYDDHRYAPFRMNVERGVPWRTLTGRQQLYLDHEWFIELGDGLPAFRPPLNVARVLGDQSPEEGNELALRYLTPHSKWSIHSEFQDNLRMLTLFRGGPGIWMNDKDALRLKLADNDWVEAHNRNGVVSCRVVVSHRIPPGTCYLYHAKGKHLEVPLSEITGKRGGANNSLTRIMIKPTHLVGGYAQLSFSFNYYGPCASQRDEVAILRKRRTEVRY